MTDDDASTPVVAPDDDAVLVSHAVAPDSVLGRFNRAGVLAPADLHVARCLMRLTGDTDESVELAAALAVRGPRVGHVYTDLATVRASAGAAVEDEAALEALPWPPPDAWLQAVTASPAVSAGPDGRPDRPLRLEGAALYLDRYWRDELAVAADVGGRAAGLVDAVDDVVAAELLAGLFADDAAGEQRCAAATALRRRLAVIVGGPGTGKTTTVARLLAALMELARRSGHRAPLVALAAPTGKAAARLSEAVHAEAARLDLDERTRTDLGRLDAATVHRLLGPLGRLSSRFRHDRANPLPHDVVVVDETSMLSLRLMAQLADAVRPDARLVLVGDPEQLASVEAGVVLADIVGPARRRPRLSAAAAASLAPLAGADVAPDPVTAPTAIGDCVMPLRANHRFTGALAELAEAVRGGDADGAVAVLGAGHPGVAWIAEDGSAGGGAAAALAAVVAHGERLVAAAASGNLDAVLDTVGEFRLLCGRRHGPVGAVGWNERVEALLAPADAVGGWYAGRPVMVTANDYVLDLFNGDVGVVVPRPDDRLAVAFRRRNEVVAVSPTLLSGIVSVYATTIHKAQGSELDQVAIVLPDPASRVLTRELLYTGLTRARRQVTVIGTEEAVRAAVDRPVARASGLMTRLWGASPDPG